MDRLITPLLTSAGLLGGFGVARTTKQRWAGGAVLAAVGAGVFVVVCRRGGPGRAAAVTVAYLAAFGGSHPLAKHLGAWPAVGAVAAAAAVPAFIV